MLAADNYTSSYFQAILLELRKGVAMKNRSSSVLSSDNLKNAVLQVLDLIETKPREITKSLAQFREKIENDEIPPLWRDMGRIENIDLLLTGTIRLIREYERLDQTRREELIKTDPDNRELSHNHITRVQPDIKLDHDPARDEPRAEAEMVYAAQWRRTLRKVCALNLAILELAYLERKGKISWYDYRKLTEIDDLLLKLHRKLNIQDDTPDAPGSLTQILFSA
jgi:hypothetical protein